MITRRSLFRGLGASLALIAAPSIVRAASLMPISVPRLVMPSGLVEWHFDLDGVFESWKRYAGYEVMDLEGIDTTGIAIWRGGIAIGQTEPVLLRPAVDLPESAVIGGNLIEDRARLSEWGANNLRHYGTVT